MNLLYCGFERRLLAGRRWQAATAVAPTASHQKNHLMDGFFGGGVILDCRGFFFQITAPQEQMLRGAVIIFSRYAG